MEYQGGDTHGDVDYAPDQKKILTHHEMGGADDEKCVKSLMTRWVVWPKIVHQCRSGLLDKMYYQSQSVEV